MKTPEMENPFAINYKGVLKVFFTIFYFHT